MSGYCHKQLSIKSADARWRLSVVGYFWPTRYKDMVIDADHGSADAQLVQLSNYNKINLQQMPIEATEIMFPRKVT